LGAGIGPRFPHRSQPGSKTVRLRSTVEQAGERKPRFLTGLRDGNDLAPGAVSRRTAASGTRQAASKCCPVRYSGCGKCPAGKSSASTSRNELQLVALTQTSSPLQVRIVRLAPAMETTFRAAHRNGSAPRRGVGRGGAGEPELLNGAERVVFGAGVRAALDDEFGQTVGKIGERTRATGTGRHPGHVSDIVVRHIADRWRRRTSVSDAAAVTVGIGILIAQRHVAGVRAAQRMGLRIEIAGGIVGERSLDRSGMGGYLKPRRRRELPEQVIASEPDGDAVPSVLSRRERSRPMIANDYLSRKLTALPRMTPRMTTFIATLVC